MPLTALFLKYREIGLMAILAILVALVGLRNPAFAEVKNLLLVLEDTSTLMILAFGMMCVMLVGSIDISIAGIMALSAMTTGILMRSFLASADVMQVVDGQQVVNAVRTSVPIALLILTGIAVGAVCGLVNGSIIAYGNVLPIVTTLGMQYILYGLCHVISGGQAVYRKDMSDAFIDFTRVDFLGINAKTWMMLIVFLAIYFFITYIRTGRSLYAVGSNREAAEMRGTRVERTIVLAHVIMGAIAGLAGLLFASHDVKVTQDMTSGYEMYVIAACVIGGVSVTGGSGKLTGVLLGALTIGVINNGLTMLKLTGTSEFWKKAIQGALILTAVVSNVVIQRVMDRQSLRRRNI